MLTNKTIDAAKARDKQYKLYDADGLYIVVTPRSVKSWRTNYKQDGKNKTKTFGLYPEISLSKARLLNAEFKDSIAAGASKDVPTFDEIKLDWYRYKLPTLKHPKHQHAIQQTLDDYASPKLGKKRIDAIRRAELVEVVREVQERGIIETAHRVAMRLRQIFDYAVDLGLLEHHPAAGLSRVLQTPKVKHMPCITPEEAPDLFKAIMNYDEPITRCGLMLLALTFTRTTELRWFSMQEIRDKKFWIIPAGRMKLKKPHVVPLAKLTLSILKELENYTGDYDLVLNSPTRHDHPISENTLLFALYRMGYKGKMTGHGFRALASTVLNEQSPFSHDVIERQLAHKESDQVRAAYNRAEYLDERIKLMDWWADWISNCLQ